MTKDCVENAQYAASPCWVELKIKGEGLSEQSMKALTILLPSFVQSHLLSLCPSLLPFLRSQLICPPLQPSSEPIHNQTVSYPFPPPLPPSQFLPVCPNQQYTVVQNFFLPFLLFYPLSSSPVWPGSYSLFVGSLLVHFMRLIHLHTNS